MLHCQPHGKLASQIILEQRPSVSGCITRATSMETVNGGWEDCNVPLLEEFAGFYKCQVWEDSSHYFKTW